MTQNPYDHLHAGVSDYPPGSRERIEDLSLYVSLTEWLGDDESAFDRDLADQLAEYLVNGERIAELRRNRERAQLDSVRAITHPQLERSDD